MPSVIPHAVDLDRCDNMHQEMAATLAPHADQAEAEPVFGDGLRLRLLRATPAEGEGPAELSPELALVDPELRTRALAELPLRDPDSFVPVRRPDVRPPTSRTGTAIGALAYAAQRSVSFAVEGTVFVGGVAGVALLVNWLR
jgi:hypothetical protein